MRWRRRRKRTDRSLKPIWSVFLFGLFITIGFDPGAMIFDIALDVAKQYISAAAVIVLIVLLYFVYNSIYSPISQLKKGYRAGGIIGIIALVLAFIAGLNVFVHYSGIIMLILAIMTWKIAVRYFR